MQATPTRLLAVKTFERAWAVEHGASYMQNKSVRILALWRRDWVLEPDMEEVTFAAAGH